MGSFLSILTAVLTNLPQIITAVVNIIKLIKSLEPQEKTQARIDLKEATAHALSTGDTSKLSQLHDNLK